MLVAGSLLAQVRPGVGPVSIFTAPNRIAITRIVICNTSTANATFSLYHDDNGNTFDVTTALYFDQPIAAKETLIIGTDSPSEGFMLKQAAQIGFGTNGGLTVSMYGVSGNVA